MNNQDNINFIANGPWFMHPLCPVIRTNGKKELGIIHWRNKTEVKYANLYLLPFLKQPFDEISGVKYDSIEQLVIEGGWHID